MHLYLLQPISILEWKNVFSSAYQEHWQWSQFTVSICPLTSSFELQMKEKTQQVQLF